MSEQSSSGSEHIVNCRSCDFHSIQPDMQNADLVRDNHEMQMFNRRGDDQPCGPCAVAQIRAFCSETEQ